MIVQPPLASQNAQVDVRRRAEDGLLVGEGTAPSATRGSDRAARSTCALRPGRAADPRRRRARRRDPGEVESLMPSDADRALDVITEPLDVVLGDSPGADRRVAGHDRALPVRVSGPGRRTQGRKAVGLFGAIEVRHVNGPMVLDRTYRRRQGPRGRPEPEDGVLWFESYADDEDGKRVAEMLMQLRWMKASSPLYAGVSLNCRPKRRSSASSTRSRTGDAGATTTSSVRSTSSLRRNGSQPRSSYASGPQCRARGTSAAHRPPTSPGPRSGTCSRPDRDSPTSTRQRAVSRGDARPVPVNTSDSSTTGTP